MLVAGFPAGAWAANCYVVAAGPGAECVIIDPGLDAIAGIDEIVTEHQLVPIAALATHGHADHVWSLAQLCRERSIPGLIHHDDRHLITDPLSGVSGETRAMLAPLVPADAVFGEPREVREVADGDVVRLAGIDFEVIGAPGHTPGSVVYRVAGDGDRPPIAFTGDVLFAGSIGRTDLPRGDTATMMRTLAQRILTLDDATVVLSGHGEATDIRRERQANPFLVGLTAERGETERGTRGA